MLDKLTYAGNLANLAEVDDSDRYEFVQGDICDPDLAGKLVGRSDAVVHFAAESHVDRSILGGADFVLTNVLGTQTLLQAALDTKLAEFVHVSTDEVYGSIETGSWDEKQPLEPNSPYSASKAGIRPDRPRLRQDPRAAGRDHPLLQQLRAVPVPGEGHPAVRHQPDRRREGAAVRRGRATSATGCTSTTTAAASRWCSTGGRSGEVYNIGGGTELTNAELTEKLLEATGRDESFIERIIDPRGGGHDQRYSVDTQDPATSSATARRCPSTRGWPTPSPGTATTGTGGSR